MEEDEIEISWYKALAEDPEYYMDTEEGQKKLAEMIRRESERLLEEIGRRVKRTREIIWLSRFCQECKYYQTEGKKMHCRRWDVRIVKPFYGAPLWRLVPSKHNEEEKELTVESIDWDQKWKEISDKIVELAIDMVNGGNPYYCFTEK
jgi:hypothetical protein